MKIIRAIVTAVLRFYSWLACRVDDAELARVPMEGPLILVANHINFLEVPVMYSHLYPRPIGGWAKVETWKNPLFAFLFSIYKATPIRRGEADLNAMRNVMEDLKRKRILAISPEGTRSYDGRLQKAKPGVVLLAVRSGVPIQPLSFWGGEHYWHNFFRLRRTPFIIHAGNPFTIDLHGQALSREVRQEVADEIMYQIAALLPPAYRGAYSDLQDARQDYLCFAPGVESNLLRAAETDRLTPPQ